jgi:integrase
LQVGLADARVAAEAARKLIGKGIDPIAARRASRPTPTFGQLADQMIAERGSELRSDKSLARWKRALQLPKLDDDGERVGRRLLPASAKVEQQRITALRALRAIPVDAVQTEHILAVLRPIWAAKPETASAARGYFEQVISAGRARGFGSGENPARWRGHLDHLLPRPQKLSRGHFKAMPFADVPAFVRELRERDAIAALALEFLILTAARTGEVIGATWDEVDLAEKVWTVPAARAKTAKEHRVPLTARTVEILEKVAPLRGETDVVFPGGKINRPLSSMGLAMLMRRMGRSDATVHGFRSAFRDWAADKSTFPRELIEGALSHAVGDAVELAYKRTDQLMRRRKLMEAWAGYLEKTPVAPKAADNVLPFGKVADA